MSEKVTVVYASMAGKKMNLPDMGIVTLGEGGEIEVPSSIGALLCEGHSPWKVQAPKNNHDEEDAERDAAKASLKEKELPELIELAKAAEIPEAEYKAASKNKSAMIAFLMKKLHN